VTGDSPVGDAKERAAQEVNARTEAMRTALANVRQAQLDAAAVAAAQVGAQRAMTTMVDDAAAMASHSVSGDPVDNLAEKMRGTVLHAVDGLHVAATLEAEGITDQMARDQYGYPDVFALADEIRYRVGSTDAPVATRIKRPVDWRGAIRDVGHGLLYLLPAAVFPAAMAFVGPRSLALGLILAGAIGWVWAGGATWMAYRLLGRGYPGAAAKLLAVTALLGIPIGVGAALVVVVTTGAGYELVLLAAGQMMYQMASGLLMFYRREDLLLLAMVPAAIVGLLYLVAGQSLLVIAVVEVVISVVAAFVIALCQTLKKRTGKEPDIRTGLRGEFAQLPAVLAYAALMAVFFLHSQAPYMLTNLEILLGFAPLITAMGVVEWRAKEFGLEARALLAKVRYPREFVGRIWILLARNVGVCLGVAALLAAILLFALQAVDMLTPAAAVMTAAGVVLAGTFFLGFRLAEMARYGWLCGSLAACSGLHIAVTSLSPQGLTPLADTTVFLGSSLLLFVLFLAAMAQRLGQARYHR
jgi:hypothetical protein